MLSTGSGNTVIKSKLISRRMFLLSVGKAIVLVGVLGRLISLQINESQTRTMALPTDSKNILLLINLDFITVFPDPVLSIFTSPYK
jgi:ribosomal protein L28